MLLTWMNSFHLQNDIGFHEMVMSATEITYFGIHKIPI